MPVGSYKQMSAIKEGVIMRLQCIYTVASTATFNTLAHQDAGEMSHRISIQPVTVMESGAAVACKLSQWGLKWSFIFSWALFQSPTILAHFILKYEAFCAIYVYHRCSEPEKLELRTLKNGVL